VLCHGTTIGTNCLIERRGARTALVTTRGFKDVIELRRQARPLLYDLDIRVSEPLAPPELRFEVDERIDADGEVVTPLGPCGPLIDALERADIQAVAISLLHCYANGAHERELETRIAERLPKIFITRSSDVCPEYREYER